MTRRPPLRWGWLVAAALSADPAVAQSPPPQPLPASITGASTPTPISPASGTTAVPAPVPVARFTADLQSFPPETVQSVYSVWAGAGWLARMNQSNGRFLAGLNPTVRVALPDESELRQAFAALALCRAAKFTGKADLAAPATQSVLTLLTLTKLDPADAACRVPDVPADRGNRVALAAVLALAVYDSPDVDAKRIADAEGLCAFLRKKCQPDGSFQFADDNKAAEAEAATLYPGLVLQALAASNRAKPEAWKRDAMAKAVAYYRAAFQAKPTLVLAAALLPGVVEGCLQADRDPAIAAAAWALADWLVSCQYTRTDARAAAWVGGFRPGPAADLGGVEPTLDSILCAEGLAAAAKLTRHVPDLNRFRTYRQAAVAGLGFARGLQFSDESADHFEKGFRTRFLVGGVRGGPTDGTVRTDATAFVVTAHLAFLQSGAEGRAE